MIHILLTDVQYRKEFDNVSIIKKLFPKEHLILGTTKGKLFCRLAYGRCSVEKLRTEEGKGKPQHRGSRKAALLLQLLQTYSEENKMLFKIT
jgi:hypothetical protein